MKTHYELLSLPPTAAPHDIKRAFRREIARYHPDKVQHLGSEFQQLAAVHAAELTSAYTVLMDEHQRTQYDLHLQAGGAAPEAGATAPPGEPQQKAPPARAATATAVEEEPEPDRPPQKTDRFLPEDFLRKASLERMRDTLAWEFPEAVPLTFDAFDIAQVLRPKRALFRKAEQPVRLLVKYVARVDALAIENNWSVTARLPGDSTTTRSVLLMAAGLAPASELASAISEQRRRHRGAPIIIVPLDVRDWSALVPADTPPIVKGLLERLRSGS